VTLYTKCKKKKEKKKDILPKDMTSHTHLSFTLFHEYTRLNYLH